MGVLEDLGCIFAMGICLDTGHRREALSLDDLQEERSLSPLVRTDLYPRLGPSLGASKRALRRQTPTSASVIFFLGAPGSGKMIHAQNLADLQDGYRHINMVVVMSEYLRENDIGTIETLSPEVAVALLAREFDYSPYCKSYLVTGFPRHSDDLHLYVEKLSLPTGAILVEWEKRTLLRNIEMGKIDGAILFDFQDVSEDAEEENRLEQAVRDSAKEALSDFYWKVLPVCEYLDHLGLLYVVSGDRSKQEIFSDIQKAHEQILSPRFLNPSYNKASVGSYREFRKMVPFVIKPEEEEEDTGEMEDPQVTLPRGVNPLNNNLPPCIFLMGGPGSNKGESVSKMMYLFPGWTSVSMANLLRESIRPETPEEEDEPPSPTYPRGGSLSPEKIEHIRSLLLKGELISQDIVLEVLRNKLSSLSDKEGIVIVGFPRDIIQAHAFEEKFGQIPPLILLDCSELELGRNLGRREARLDDNVAAAHRRLSIYRKVTLPMLKAFDEKHRLKIIDGDADNEQVAKELKRSIFDLTKMLAKNSPNKAQKNEGNSPSPSRGSNVNSMSPELTTVDIQPQNEDPFMDEFSD